MNKDILGKKELEALKLNWSCSPEDGRCFATGTCDNLQIRNKKYSTISNEILFKEDTLGAEDIKLRYGYLRL